MSNERCVVVIPVHSATPGINDLISFQQCFKVLAGHPIKVIAPDGLNLAKYKTVVPHFETEFIAAHWQSSLLNYNRLKLSKFFYKLFAGYEYILTYELDAFVFRDEVDDWCDKGYDFIGAPWFEGFHQPYGKIIGVGNSGFSMRKTATFSSAINKVYTDHIYAGTGRRGNVIKKQSHFCIQ